MKFGWRNDPLWVEHYRLRDERLSTKRIGLATLAHQKMLHEVMTNANRPGAIEVVHPESVPTGYRRVLF